jgi:fructose-1,6-bisphosphatase/inositol monophosphatase family enzyme
MLLSGSGHYHSDPTEKADQESAQAVAQRLKGEDTDFAQSKEESEKELGQSLDPSPS